MTTVQLLSKVIEDVETLKRSTPVQTEGAVKWKQFVQKFNSHTTSLKFEILQLIQVLEPLKVDFSSCIDDKKVSKLTGLIGAIIA